MDDFEDLNEEIRQAAKQVIENWAKGNLGGAVNRLRLALDDYNRALEIEEGEIDEALGIDS